LKPRAPHIEKIKGAAPAATRSDHRRGADRERTRAAKEKTMDMTQYAGASFIKFDDVRDGPFRGKIKEVTPGKFDRPVLGFADGAKLTLNTTNVKILCRTLGPDSRGWIGHIVECFAGETKFQDEVKDSVLVRPLTAPTEQQLAERAAAKPPPEMNDQIPF
jgi:hypothetical protein